MIVGYFFHSSSFILGKVGHLNVVFACTDSVFQLNIFLLPISIPP